MYLSDINEAFGHRITSGSEYGWRCYGDSARALDYSSEFADASVVYSTDTLEIYEANVELKGQKRPYRWLNPEYSQELIAESTARSFDHTVAWDDVKWIDLELAEDFLEKARAIFNGESFDQRIQVPLELEDDLFIQLAKEAHERDITLNAMVELVLRRAIEQYETLGEVK